MVVIDKTGTLTFGRPEVQRIVCAEGVAVEKVLDTAASAELRSEHPLSKAIVGLCTLGMGLAAFGLLGPLLAAFIHVTSEMTFILNSARLLGRNSRTRKRAEV